MGRRIERLRAARGLEPKQVYEPLGWDKGEYSRKTKGKTPISMGDYAKLHALLRGWTGFPFVDEGTGKILDAIGEGRLTEILEYLAKHPRSR